MIIWKACLQRGTYPLKKAAITFCPELSDSINCWGDCHPDVLTREEERIWAIFVFCFLGSPGSRTRSCCLSFSMISIDMIVSDCPLYTRVESLKWFVVNLQLVYYWNLFCLFVFCFKSWICFCESGQLYVFQIFQFQEIQYWLASLTESHKLKLFRLDRKNMLNFRIFQENEDVWLATLLWTLFHV